MKKILFLIHDLGGGGAEKVLVNLVNHMDREKWNITVMALFGGGINERFLKPDIRLINCHKKALRGNSHLMKLFSPRFLYRKYIREQYDIVISFLEGPCARIVSGCEAPETRKIAWIHSTLADKKTFSMGFRNFAEAVRCYQKFDCRIFVSADTQRAFETVCPGSGRMLPNVPEVDRIAQLSREDLEDPWFCRPGFYLCGMGKLTANKGFHRLLSIHRRLREEGFALYTYILGSGEEQAALQNFIDKNHLRDSVKLLGYQTNPYPYLQKADLFVCASYSEGFSTAATEALILGTPVCTTRVAGMTQMLGDGQFGVITDNNEEALCNGIRSFLEDARKCSHYRQQAAIRGRDFSTDAAVAAVEAMLEEICL